MKVTDSKSERGSISAFYNAIAPLYDHFASSILFSRLREQTVAATSIEPGDAVLELGCGTGGNIEHVSRHLDGEGTYIGVDISRGMITRGSSRHVDSDVLWVLGDATRPPVRKQVDAILATFLVGMLPNPAEAIETWLELLTDDGHLALLNAPGRADSDTLLDIAFRLGVNVTAPPETRQRFDGSPHEILRNRVQTAHRALDEHARITYQTTYWRSFVRLTVATPNRD